MRQNLPRLFQSQDKAPSFSRAIASGISFAPVRGMFRTTPDRLGRIAAILALGAFLWLPVAVSHAASDLPLSNIRVPAGFEINLYARVPNARSLALSPKGTLFVGTVVGGKVYAVPAPATGAGPGNPVVVASSLNTPNGVAFRDGSLYVAEISRILRFDEIDSHLNAPPKPAVITDRFPTDRHHGWKFIAFGP